MKDRSHLRVLVSGSGSIGRRHIRNLRALGVQRIAAYDPDPERLQPMIEEMGIEPFGDFTGALDAFRPDAVFICTPPVFHVVQALQGVRYGAHVFVEKPLSHSMEQIDELIGEANTRSRVVQVGYNLRFHPGLLKLKELLEKRTIGRILWAHIEAAQYLPEWRPWQDYRQSYTARRELGGGIVLDGSHEIDYAIWLFGRPVELVSMIGHVSDLQINVEDCATLLMRLASGAQVDVHLDFVQRGYTRLCKLVGSDGSIIWDYPNNQVRIHRVATDAWETINYEFDPNEMYVREVEHFFECVEQGSSPKVDLIQAKAVLEVCLAAKSSLRIGTEESYL